MGRPDTDENPMKIKRIVTNLQASSTDKAKAFYQDFLGLDLLMDLDWVHTYGCESTMPIQLSIASQGGSDTPVPALSVEVDDLNSALKKAEQLNLTIEYGPVHESWGVHRFFVRDPFGHLINILEHE